MIPDDWVQIESQILRDELKYWGDAYWRNEEAERSGSILHYAGYCIAGG